MNIVGSIVHHAKDLVWVSFRDIQGHPYHQNSVRKGVLTSGPFPGRGLNVRTRLPSTGAAAPGEAAALVKGPDISASRPIRALVPNESDFMMPI
jgi:hypothetical protein